MKKGTITNYIIYPLFLVLIMSKNEKTPLWLELKKEYIDDNFEQLKVYLRKLSDQSYPDKFYEETVGLLRRRICDLNNEVATQALYSCDGEQKNETTDTTQKTFKASLLATYLLIEKNNNLLCPAYLALMNELAQLHPNHARELTRLAVQRMQHEKVETLGFFWSDLDTIHEEVFVHNLLKQSKFSKPYKSALTHTQAGTAHLDQMGLRLSPLGLVDTLRLMKDGSDSLNTQVEVALRTISSERLKVSHEKDPEAIETFVETFLHEQEKTSKQPSQFPKKSYFEDNEATMRITRIEQGKIYAETIDPNYERLEGPVEFKRAYVPHYSPEQIGDFFQVGDHVTCTIIETIPARFDMALQLRDFLLEDAKEILGDEEFLAKLIATKNNQDFWISDAGIGVCSPKSNDLEKGDFALLRITGYGDKSAKGFIYTELMEISEDYFDEYEERKKCIEAFVDYCTPIEQASNKMNTQMLSPQLLALLLRLLFRTQRFLQKPTERFHFLANALAMAQLVEDKKAISYIRFSMQYLKLLVRFVSTDSVGDAHLLPDEEYAGNKTTLIRLSIIDLLKEYGKKEHSEKLAKSIEDFKTSLPMLSNLAKYIQAANLLQDLKAGSAHYLLKEKIVNTLAIETEHNTVLEEEEPIYLGEESGSLEFKTSIVFPPNSNMQAAMATQANNVMKGVCGFLNSSTGGTLYLGVNDSGYIVGLGNDMQKLNIYTMDSYVRYVSHQVKTLLGEDVLPYVKIEPQYDNQVVALCVTPHPQHVVELHGTAYLRTNSESRAMSEEMRQQVMAEKTTIDKQKLITLSLLQRARQEKKCVILHNYSSSYSGITSDRRVEAYKILSEQNLAVAYDRDKNVCHIFNISRIGYVEILDNEKWQHASEHQDLQVDAFHMSGEKPIHIILHMDLFARNLLVEEYPTTKNLFCELNKGTGRWHFETDVYNLAGVGRFYLGLANHIEIVEGEELKEYAIKCLQETLSSLTEKETVQ